MTKSSYSSKTYHSKLDAEKLVNTLTTTFNDEVTTENIRKQSEANLDIISEELKKKFFSAKLSVYNAATKIGLDTKNYDIYLTDFFSQGGVYHMLHTGENYTTISTFVLHSCDELTLIKIIAHELLVHCLINNNYYKRGPKRMSWANGVHFHVEDSQGRWQVVDNHYFSKLKRSYKERTLSKSQIECIQNFKQRFSLKRTRQVFDWIIWKLKRDPSKSFKFFINNRTSIGFALNEGVTDYLAISIVANNKQEKDTLIKTSAYKKWVQSIHRLQQYLAKQYAVTEQEFEECLYGMQQVGSPKILKDFIYSNTGRRVSFKQLFSCNFSSVYKSKFAQIKERLLLTSIYKL